MPIQMMIQQLMVTRMYAPTSKSESAAEKLHRQGCPKEKKNEKARNSGGDGSEPKKSPSSTTLVVAKGRKEGGVEVLVEKTTDGNIRIRARRCNMDNKTIVKEMSEEVIVRSLKKAVETWVKARDVTGL